MSAREAIALAALDLVAAGGVEAVSVRTVAARAGVSPGSVQHHYGTKQQLLVAAVELVGRRVRARLETAAADADPTERLRTLARQLLPLDDRRRDEARVWLAFVARAAVDPEIAALHSREWAALQAVFAALLAARRPGAAAVTPADDDAAAHLLAVLDGLAVAGIAEDGRMGPDRTSRLLDDLLERWPLS
ncbi:TetR family transcriptional regulator [Kineococcus sp. NBC_00420]|uniref:TetR/AcrR family transcriptional regulator n=1 Tax=unclassified Kineococcus TaxID=2621656 RepID=UPI002E1B14A0